jgi:hypothetical protein
MDNGERVDLCPPVNAVRPVADPSVDPGLWLSGPAPPIPWSLAEGRRERLEKIAMIPTHYHPATCSHDPLIGDSGPKL